MTSLPQDQLNNAVRILRDALPTVQAVLLYGSEAAGRARVDSDVDLAILNDKPVAPLELYELSCALMEAFPTKIVDLVDLTSPNLSLILKVEVYQNHLVLFEARPQIIDSAQVEAIAQYQELYEARSEMAAAFRESLRPNAAT